MRGHSKAMSRNNVYKVHGRTWDENCILIMKDLPSPRDWATQREADVKIQSYTCYLAENMIEHSTILSSEENGSLVRGQGLSLSMVLPTLPSRAWRSCHTSKWLWVAHQKKCLGPLLCPHDQPKSSMGTSLGGSRSWLCYHRHLWARSLHG